MTSTLMWKPVEDAEGSLPDTLKRVISRKLWDTDGSCGVGRVTVDTEDLLYIEGLKDAGIKGAAELIALVLEHGEIELWHEN